ncbi:MAG: aminoglycoside phosphotransferase family protein [Terrimicrobiaceae bacterium]|nr:aminoglycoside phosphotransferase family protein [Terrimicrobiaceae bacterium]
MAKDGLAELRQWLANEGLAGGQAVVEEMGGGVSSDVWLVREGGRSFVVKRSVPKLRVKADWFSNPARLRYEFLYLETLATIVPGAAPRLLSHSPDSPFLAMEYLGAEFANWKSLMLAGDIRPAHAERAGEILGRVHTTTTESAAMRQRFDTLEFFTQLRIEAYLLATAEKWPGRPGQAIREEAERLLSHREALVHGDYSPKNMLAGPERFVVLDCETACFGDPAFDLGFVLNHLCLKGLFHAGRESAGRSLGLLRQCAAALREAYARSHPLRAPAIESRTARLLPMLLLARVDGKSPVEYLDAPRQQHVRQLAPTWLSSPADSLGSLLEAWFTSLESPTFSS